MFSIKHVSVQFINNCYDVAEHKKVLRENEMKSSFLSALQELD